MKRFLMIFVFAVLLLTLAACGGGAEVTSEPNTLTAVKVDAASLDVNAAYWDGAPLLSVDTQPAVEGNPDGPVVKMQAVYDGQYVAIRAEWADPTQSLKNLWTWDGTAFSKSGDEDRLMMLFPIQNNAEFASKGCAAACHNNSDNQDEWWMGSSDAALTYDAWHAKSTRTYPAGYVDDKWWGVQEDPADVESSRHGDAKDSGGEQKNVNEAGDGPAFMNAEGPGLEPIFTADAVPVDTSILSAGDTIYGYTLEKPVGSRGDIEANAVWADGTWVVVYRRLLNTGHDDDVTFSPPKSVPFGMSVVDNGGGLPHAVSADVLTLSWK